MSNPKNFNLLSLFSGGGFLDLGFLNQGFSINQAVEINPFFIEAYNEGLRSYYSKVFDEKKHGTYHVMEGALDASKKEILDTLKQKNQGVAGIIGGPPCQDYSVGGANAGHNGARGKLIYSYFEIVKKVDPAFIFFENVPGLFNTREHNKAFMDLVKMLGAEDYVVWYDILNALEYGVPQDRSRLTLVGFKREIVNRLEAAGYKGKQTMWVENPDELVFNWPGKIYDKPKQNPWPGKWLFGSDIIQTDVDRIPKELSVLQVINAFNTITSDSPNQGECFNPKSDKFLRIDEGDTNRKSFKRLHRYRYSPTVAYGNNEVHLHPTEARRLTVREALKIQSVPDEYVLPASVPLSHKFKLISNGVPTRKAELIAHEIKRTLENYYALL
ncbi:MAG: DNA cytosine methyltransferase [Bacteroidetes bacterium]|nr:DNA cytosine methyltransferase [Bacteroidota bacterium]